MAKLSRRGLIAGAAVAPLALNGAATAKPASEEGPRSTPLSAAPMADPVAAMVSAWMADRDQIDALTLEWQDLESALCMKTRSMGLTLTQACRSKLPEALAMRSLDRRVKTGLKRLDRNARAIVLMRATSMEGALAKIRMGLKIQGPYDWEDYAYALAQDGCEQIAFLLSEAQALKRGSSR